MHEQWDITSSVGLTALLVAAGRSAETEREDPLITDELAGAFVREADPDTTVPLDPSRAEDETQRQLLSLSRDYMALRTRFLDEFLEGAGTAQVVILAAGLDTRAFRLAFPAGTTVFEVDQPKVLEFKQEVLDRQGAVAACDRRLVPADLREDWVSALRAEGFDPGKPTAWLAEGLLPYLPAAAEEELFEHIRRLSAPGSVLTAEDPGSLDGQSAMFQSPRLVETSKQMGIDITSLLSDEPRRDCADSLRETGWQVAVTGLSGLEERYGRTLPRDEGLFDHIRMVTARR